MGPLNESDGNLITPNSEISHDVQALCLYPAPVNGSAFAMY